MNSFSSVTATKLELEEALYAEHSRLAQREQKGSILPTSAERYASAINTIIVVPTPDGAVLEVRLEDIRKERARQRVVTAGERDKPPKF